MHSTSTSQPADLTRLSVWAVAALVLLRLAVGWHFYAEGVEKLKPGFSAAALIRASKGPLSDFYQSFAPIAPGYRQWLATPRRAGLSPAQLAEQAAWPSRFQAAVAEAEESAEPAPLAFPPHTAYSDWGNFLAERWAAMRDRATSAGVDRTAAATACTAAFNRLAGYLGDAEVEIEAWRHELWRLEQMREHPGAGSLPYLQQRIAEKAWETGRTGRAWAAGVTLLEEQYAEELANAAAGVDPPKRPTPDYRPQAALGWINRLVTWTVLGVGVCLMVGLATRVAAVAGFAFLLAVMASQPPWVVGAETTYFGYQLAESAAMLVLASVGAGRWYGLDSLLRRCCSVAC